VFFFLGFLVALAVQHVFRIGLKSVSSHGSSVEVP